MRHNNQCTHFGTPLRISCFSFCFRFSDVLCLISSSFCLISCASNLALHRWQILLFIPSTTSSALRLISFVLCCASNLTPSILLFLALHNFWIFYAATSFTVGNTTFVVMPVIMQPRDNMRCPTEFFRKNSMVFKQLSVYKKSFKKNIRKLDCFYLFLRYRRKS